MNTCTCACGSVATTEIQSGWNPDANGGVGGGVYTPLCERCYDETPEAAFHRNEHYAILRFVRDGCFKPKEMPWGISMVYRGLSHSPEDHAKMLAEAASIPDQILNAAVHSRYK